MSPGSVVWSQIKLQKVLLPTVLDVVLMWSFKWAVILLCNVMQKKIIKETKSQKRDDAQLVITVIVIKDDIS